MNLRGYLDQVRPESEKLLGATSIEEQAFCEWFAEHRLIQGGVVEFGPWLGSLTIPTARGMRRNTSMPPRGRVIDTYDLFRWNPGFEGWVAQTPYAGRYQSGDSFLPLFEEICAPYILQGILRIHQENLELTHWSGQPIEFLINDSWKTVSVMSNTIREFFPSLIRNAVVFHQDYLWSSDSFIHIGMFHLRHCFEFVCRVRNSCTAVFCKIRDIPANTLANLASRKTVYDFSESEIRDAFKWSKSLFTDPEATLVVDAGKAWMLYAIGKIDAARSVFSQIKRSDYCRHPFYRFQEDTLRNWGLSGMMD